MGNEDLGQILNEGVTDSLLDSLALICRLYGVATSKDALPLKSGIMMPALIKRSADAVTLAVTILKNHSKKFGKNTYQKFYCLKMMRPV